MREAEDNTTKMRIINSAITLFKESGYKKVSVSDICKLSGITRSAFYYHFKSKEEILDNYFITPEDYISNNLISILHAPNYFNQFFRIFEVFLESCVEAGPEILGQILKRNIDRNVHILSPHNITMWDVYVNLIKKAQEAGELLNPLPAERLAEAFVYISEGIAMDWCNQGGAFDLREEHRLMLETLLIVQKDY